MNRPIAKRADLAEFLVARRKGLQPDDVGLQPGSRRRTPGLRREEVAQLAGVSVSWYTWLEQGRPINVSADVLDALARTLRLDAVETDHLFLLAGNRRAQPPDPSAHPGVPEAVTHPVRAVLDALAPSPAYVLGPLWHFLAWNDPFARLYPVVERLAGDECNLVWVVFAEPSLRRLIVGWEDEARGVLSQFRAETTPWRQDPGLAALVDRVRGASKEFAEWWPRHDVAGFRSRIRTFDHPIAGVLRFRQEQLHPADQPDTRIVVHLPLPGDDSVERLAYSRHHLP